MIINTDEIRYILFYHSDSTLKSVIQMENMDNIIKQPNFGWYMYLIHKNIIRSRCLDSEHSCLDILSAYFTLNCFIGQDICEWPETEEIIRKIHAYRKTYEEHTRKRI